jgi:hypothetical protein
MKHIFRIILILCMFSVSIHAEDKEDMRLRAGLDLFPSFLAADMDISEKKGNGDYLLLLIVYADNKTAAEDVAEYLKKIGKIRNIPIRTELISMDSLKIRSDQIVAGIFMSQPIHYKLESLIRFAGDHHAILFSPFKGDVELGVMGGLIVKEKILPYINMMAIQSAGIRIKDFFIRIDFYCNFTADTNLISITIRYYFRVSNYLLKLLDSCLIQFRIFNG